MTPKLDLALRTEDRNEKNGIVSKDRYKADKIHLLHAQAQSPLQKVDFLIACECSFVRPTK